MERPHTCPQLPPCHTCSVWAVTAKPYKQQCFSSTCGGVGPAPVSRPSGSTAQALFFFSLTHFCRAVSDGLAASLSTWGENECWRWGPLATCSTCTVGDCLSFRTRGACFGLGACAASWESSGAGLKPQRVSWPVNRKYI